MSGAFAVASSDAESPWSIVHTLVVLDFDDDGDHFDVEHTPLCPVETREKLPDEGEYEAVVCPMQQLIDDCGIGGWFVHADAPAEERLHHSNTRAEVSVGRHAIKAWFIAAGIESEFEAGIDLIDAASS